ncbi:MAG: leucine-rich repeat domain-containing protein [Planctomycetota bacterium]|jgi:hypothetical protein
MSLRTLGVAAIGFALGVALTSLFVSRPESASRAERAPTYPSRDAEENEAPPALPDPGAADDAYKKRVENLFGFIRGDDSDAAVAGQALQATIGFLQRMSPDRFGDLTPRELFYSRELDLSGTEVTDDDLLQFQHLPSLRTLTLRRTEVGDGGLVHLAKIPSLKQLGLRETKVTDAGMAHIPGIAKLTHLDLNMLPITDDGLAHIRGLDQLEFLRLNYTRITDVGLSYLTKLTALKRLDLWGTPISDKRVEYLWRLPSLQHLELGATPITKEWVARFQKAHPQCTVRSRHSR